MIGTVPSSLKDLQCLTILCALHLALYTPSFAHFLRSSVARSLFNALGHLILLIVQPEIFKSSVLTVCRDLNQNEVDLSPGLDTMPSLMYMCVEQFCAREHAILSLYSPVVL